MTTIIGRTAASEPAGANEPGGRCLLYPQGEDVYAFLCNSNGTRLLGSDGVIQVDGRKTLTNRISEVKEYRGRFKKHFIWKYRSWTHVYFGRTIRSARPVVLHPLS